MKRLFTLFMLLLLVGMVNAKVGSVDTECQAYGFDYGIEKFETNDNGGYILEEDHPDYDISVSGTLSQASWTATPSVDGVLIKGGQNYYSYDGGTSGTVYSSDVGHDISHITFCGSNEEVPEFGVIAGAIALVGALGIFMYRRK